MFAHGRISTIHYIECIYFSLNWFATIVRAKYRVTVCIHSYLNTCDVYTYTTIKDKELREGFCYSCQNYLFDRLVCVCMCGCGGGGGEKVYLFFCKAVTLY